MQTGRILDCVRSGAMRPDEAAELMEWRRGWEAHRKWSAIGDVGWWVGAAVLVADTIVRLLGAIP